MRRVVQEPHAASAVVVATLAVSVWLMCVGQSTSTAVSTDSASQASTYYVDSLAGDDSQSGLSPTNAWRSLERVNSRSFQPGDHILFKAGARYTGQLKPQGSGASVQDRQRPIVVGKYGGDSLPRIDADGTTLDALLLRNVEFWEIQDLEITNLGTNCEPWRTGVHIVADNFGTLRHIHLRNLFVHDVNGSLDKQDEGCGIFFESRGRRPPSQFDELLIEHCHLVRTDRNGICQRNGSGPHSRHVVIRDNLLEDIGGDGIKPWGSDAPLIERNVVHGARMRCADYAAGVWPFDCDDALIQFNEVSGMKGTKDGQGFDSDFRCHRSVFQYNYSHDNEGGFMLICAPGNSFNQDTVIRYNISQNDGLNKARVFHISGNVKNTQIYNNTIYIGPKQDLPLLLFTDWSGGNAEGTKFLNNIFFVDGRVRYEWGQSRSNTFSHNVFFGNHRQIPPDPYAFTNRPPLLRPGGGENGMNSLSGYKPGNPVGFPRGEFISNNGGRDFFGQQVPAPQPPFVGAVFPSE
jgi:hypothetical protein